MEKVLHNSLKVIADNVYNNKFNHSALKNAIVKLDKFAHQHKFPQAVINSMRDSEKEIYINVQLHDLYRSDGAFYNLKYQIQVGNVPVELD